MKIQLKRLENGKWTPVNVKEIAGKSIVKYMLESLAPMIAAVLEDDKPVLFISNSEEWVEKCKARGVSMSAATLMELCGTEIFPKISLDYLEESSIIEIKSLK